MNSFECKINSMKLSKIQGTCDDPRLDLSQLNDETDRRRVPLQDEDHPENDPHMVPGFPRLCSGTFPQRFRSVSVSAGSREFV